MDLRYPQNQKLQGFKSGGLGRESVGNCRLIILSKKWWRSSCFKQWAIWGRAPSCIKTVYLWHRLAFRAGIINSSSNEAYCWLVTVHLTLLVVWNKCTSPISVTTKSLVCNFRQFYLLDPPNCILAAIACEDISRSWSTVFPSHLHPTLKKA